MELYIHENGNTFGPVDDGVLREEIDAGRITASAFACPVGESQWIPLREVAGISGVVLPPPLPPPPVTFALPQINVGKALNRVAGRITTFAGVEAIEGLSGRQFFSEALKKRSDDEIEELFITGTRNTTPPLSAVNTQWPKPWAFMKAFIASIILFIGFFYGVLHFDNLKLLPGLLFVGSFAIPFSTLILFVELNVPRNVSLYQVFKLVIFGGIASILLSLFLYTIVNAEDSWGGALVAGIVEETGKIGAVLLLMRNRQFNWTLNGLLLGAAVGTGFAAFESAGYGLNSFLHDIGNALQGADTYEMYWTIGIRALLTPAGHITWTALATASLWKVKNGRPFDMQMLKDPRFLRVFGLAVALHTLWDAPFGFPLLGDVFGFAVKCLILGIVAWIVVLSYVQDGLKQIRTAQEIGLPQADNSSVDRSNVDEQLSGDAETVNG